MKANLRHNANLRHVCKKMTWRKLQKLPGNVEAKMRQTANWLH